MALNVSNKMQKTSVFGQQKSAANNISYKRTVIRTNATEPQDFDKKVVNAPEDVKESIYPRVEELELANSPQSNSSTTWFGAHKFSGPIPEVVNGRLAMLAFSAALGAELFTGVGVVDQFKQAILPVVGLYVAIWVASALPVFKGFKQQKEGSFNFKNELINGRAAMLGFAILLGFELISHKTMFTQLW